MTPEERTLLTGFFDRLGQAPAQEKDREADGLIREAVGRDPDLAYRMAQTALIYEQGLGAAQAQIRQLQEQLQARPPAALPASTGGSFLGSVPRVPAARPMPGAAMAPGGMMAGNSFGGAGFGRGGYGGGQSFLGSAMSTALGVAGGMALFSGLESMFSGGGMAAEAAVPQDVADQGAADAPAGDAAAAGPWGAPSSGDAGASDPGSYDQAAYDPASTTYDQGVYDPAMEDHGDAGGFDSGGFDDFDF